MQSVAFFHQKGGTGKSTLAMASALFCAAQGHRVILVDVDNQGTTTHWWQQCAHHYPDLALETRGQLQESLPALLPRLSHSFDLCLIDAPPALTQSTIKMLEYCDGLIIPTRPSPPDLWALERLSMLLHTPPLDTLSHRLVFNQHQGEDLSLLQNMPAVQDLDHHPTVIPYHEAYPALFLGQPLTLAIKQQMAALMSSWLPQ
ncbi:ParA family protein [Magnetococcus sp. PR-3]|uniref:ParA family protein n=1 Tax=Magnetococcus sp. PR-3 TaxID=3120355 RepID=UPI002FCE50E9